MDWIQYVLLGLIVLFLVNRFRPVKGLTNITATGLHKKIKNGEKIKIVDVREPFEFSSKHIKSAINIPLGRIDYVAEKQLNKDDQLILVCRSGNRSKQAAKKLAKRGYVHLFNLSGGMLSWKD